MRKLSLVIPLLSIALIGVARGEDKPKSEKPTTTATTAPAPAGDVIEASDIEKLKAAVGKTVTAHGKVSGNYKSNTGRILLNFEGAKRDFVAMIPKEATDAVNAGFDGDVAKAVEGKAINVTGEVKLYKDKPQIEVTKPEQIQIQSADEYR